MAVTLAAGIAGAIVGGGYGKWAGSLVSSDRVQPRRRSWVGQVVGLGCLVLFAWKQATYDWLWVSLGVFVVAGVIGAVVCFILARRAREDN